MLVVVMLTVNNYYCNSGVSKNLFKCCTVLQIDFQTHVFGSLITRGWICSLPGIKGHPCDLNEATQLVNYLMHY